MERRVASGVELAEVLIGESAAWVAVRAFVERVGTSELPVLVTGETGTGKEMVARALHALSRRAGRGFVAHNCGATPDSLIESELFGHARGAFTGAVADRCGLFDAADGGTLFLDEIGDASPLLQMKLLRVLQEGEARRVGDTRVRRVDVRVVSATNRRLEDAVREQRFRVDLFYRLNAVQVHLPPLRERGEDAVLLAHHFARRAAERERRPPPRLSGAFLDRLRRHPWPGNVRELANACAYALVVAGDAVELTPRHLPPTLGEGATEPLGAGLHAETRALEERRLRETLERLGGNKSRAARELGLSRQGLLKKLRRYGMLGGDAGAPLDAARSGS
jgi:transcriptional regulator with PAS, ATPase and Fis domain